jgi:hypothetical protein
LATRPGDARDSQTERTCIELPRDARRRCRYADTAGGSRGAAGAAARGAGKIDTLSSSYDSVTAERDALVEQNERLRHLLLKLQRRQFGRKSERLTDEQLQFAFEEIEATLAENAAEAGKRSPATREQQKQRRRAGRGRLPAHLPEIEQVLAPEATTCPCCQGPLVEIGSDTARGDVPADVEEGEAALPALSR